MVAGISGRKDCQGRSRAVLMDICWEGHCNVYEKLNKFNLHCSGEGTGCKQGKDSHSKSMDLGQSASILELRPHCRSVCAFGTSPLFLPQGLCTYCLYHLEDAASPPHLLHHTIYLLFRLWCHLLKYLSSQPSPTPYSTSSKPQSPYDSTPHSCNFIFICVII